MASVPMLQPLLPYTPDRDVYRLLGVQSSASTDEITAACRRLARTFHPTTTGATRATAGDAGRQHGSQVLTNPDTRPRRPRARALPRHARQRRIPASVRRFPFHPCTRCGGRHRRLSAHARRPSPVHRYRRSSSPAAPRLPAVDPTTEDTSVLRAGRGGGGGRGCLAQTAADAAPRRRAGSLAGVDFQVRDCACSSSGVERRRGRGRGAGETMCSALTSKWVRSASRVSERPKPSVPSTVYGRSIQRETMSGTAFI